MPGSDGIGDAPYVIDENNIDHYPLMSPWVSKLPGDVNKDGKVDMTDVGIILRAYGTTSSSPNWNPNCDTNNDNKVDMSDVGIALRNYGKTE
ncbi:MAG: dockerin type I domain-containing protein [Candidatus Bathyarchaeia archaeon]